jgi:hypothetical protein
LIWPTRRVWISTVRTECLGMTYSLTFYIRRFRQRA